MMGHRSKRFKLFTETNLEALLPADNLYHQLEGKLDLSFVRDLVRDRYGEIGRRSIDPVVFFKLQLIAFFEGITSERGPKLRPRALPQFRPAPHSHGQCLRQLA